LKYPERLSSDLKYLADYYEWNDDDKKEIRAAFTDSPEMVRYFICLAAAHRAGYKQGAFNGHVRLSEWCKEKGLGDPYGEYFDPKEFDLMAAQENKLLR
jgi:hypothetical protein